MALDPSIYSQVRPIQSSPLATLGELANYRELQLRQQGQQAQQAQEAWKLQQEQRAQASQDTYNRLISGPGNAPPAAPPAVPAQAPTGGAGLPGLPGGATPSGQPAPQSTPGTAPAPSAVDTLREQIRTQAPEHLPAFDKAISDAAEKAAVTRKALEEANDAHAKAVSSMDDYVGTQLVPVIRKGQYQPLVANAAIDLYADHFKGMTGTDQMTAQWRQAASQGPDAVKALVEQFQAAHDARHPPTEAELAMRAAGGEPQAQGAMAILKPPVAKATNEWEDFKASYAQGLGKQAWEQLDPQTRTAGLAAFTKAKQDPATAATAGAMKSIALEMAQTRLAALKGNSSDPKEQDKLENQYRTILMRPMSSRSGGLGLEDAKVQQANHLMALLDQNKDPKTGQYNVPKVQMNELALGLARLVSPGGAVGEGMMHDLSQATAAGDFNKALTYITGTPFNGSTQDVIKMFRDSIDRQANVAVQNREQAMGYIRGLAPTALDEDRRLKLEAHTLVPYRGGASAAPTSASVPANVSAALKGATPGRHTLSDGSVWTIDASGNITK